MDLSRNNAYTVGKGKPPLEHCFKPGNPGGSAPKGKRVSTWMAELGEVDPADWPKKKKISANERIARARVIAAMTKQGLRDTELILNRTEGAIESTPQLPMLQGIAAAILAMKAAGVALKKAEPIEAEVVQEDVVHEETKNEGDEADEDEPDRSKRFRQGRT